MKQNVFQKKHRSNAFYEEELQKNDDGFFKENIRMDRENFQLLCSMLPCLKKKNTRFKKAISLEKRIAIALYALGSSSEYRTVANTFGVGTSTVPYLLIDFCTSVVTVMKDKYLNKHLLPENMDKKIEGFAKMGLPQCFGAVGKDKK